MYTVYAHVNKANGMAYVGYTSKTIRHRWLAHVRASKCPKTYFQHALHMHGSSDDVWHHIEVSQHETADEAKRAERLEIKHRQSNDPLKGYNSTTGGNGSSTPKSELTKSRISAARKGKCIGSNHPMFNGHPCQKLTVSDVVTIKEAPVTISHACLADAYGVTPQTIWAVRIGRSWKHVRPDLNKDASVFYRWHNGYTNKNTEKCT